MSSIYGVAPDYICDFPAEIEEPIDIENLGAHIEKLLKPIGTFGLVTFDGFDIEFKASATHVFLPILEAGSHTAEKKKPHTDTDTVSRDQRVQARAARLLGFVCDSTRQQTLTSSSAAE